MTTRTAQDHVEALLTRQVVEPRTRGAPAPDVEAAALFEAIALSFLLNPRASIYIAFLARNALVAAAQQELSALLELRAAIADLANVSLAVRDTTQLENAQVALLQMEGQGQLAADGSTFKRFSAAIDSFLQNQLSKNVRRPGSATMARPSVEAARDMPGLYEALQVAHADVLDRLYALSVGVTNFLSTPLSTILSLGAASRARADIQDLIDGLSTDPSGTLSRDAATRLIADRATLKVLGTQPDLSRPVLDSSENLPLGYRVKAISRAASPESTSSVGPWAFPAGANLTVQVGATFFEEPNFPQTSVDQANAAVLVGVLTSFPVSIEPEESLFLTVVAQDTVFTLEEDGSYTSVDLGTGWALVDGSYSKTLRANLNATSSTASAPLADIISVINTQLASLVQADEYILAGTSRIYLRANPLLIKSLLIGPMHIAPSTSTVGAPSVYTKSANEKVGFYVGQGATEGLTVAIQVSEAFNRIFAGLATMQRNSDGTVTVKAVSDEPGIEMSITGSAAEAMGLDGTFVATSAEIFLYGTVNEVHQDPVNPVPVVELGDVVVSGTGTAAVTGVSSSAIQLSEPIPTFDGDVRVESGIYRAWKALDTSLQSFVDDWVAGPYSKGLARVDRVMAGLVGSQTPAQRNAATAALDDLGLRISEMMAVLLSAQIPVGGGTVERQVVDGVVQALTERKYDRAVDLLLRCRIQEVFELDWQSASYGGAVMQAASNIARTDLTFPNRAVSDEPTVKALDTRREFPR
jgi:hypothetical protein